VRYEIKSNILLEKCKIIKITLSNNRVKFEFHLKFDREKERVNILEYSPVPRFYGKCISVDAVYYFCKRAVNITYAHKQTEITFSHS
jgi:hypothetical protein